MFEHAKLQVYQLSRELNRAICRITKVVARGHYDPLDQLVRAGASITRNIAEGSGEFTAKEKAKFYRTPNAPPQKRSPVSTYPWATR